jgi:hypothetical protein
MNDIGIPVAPGLEALFQELMLELQRQQLALQKRQFEEMQLPAAWQQRRLNGFNAQNAVQSRAGFVDPNLFNQAGPAGVMRSGPPEADGAPPTYGNTSAGVPMPDVLRQMFGQMGVRS